MSIEQMQKVLIISFVSEREKVLSFLQNAKVFQLSSKKLSEPANTDIVSTDGIHDIEKALEILNRISLTKKSFIENFAPYKELVSLSQLEELFSSYAWKAICKEIIVLDEELKKIELKINELNNKKQLLIPWINLKVKLNALNCTKTTCIILGSIPSKKENIFVKDIETHCKYVAWQKVSKYNDRTYFLIFHYKDYPLSEEVLSKYGFVKVVLPLSENTPKEELKSIESEILTATQKKEKLLASLKDFVKETSNLKKIYDFLFQQVLKQNFQNYASQTKKTVYWTGWMPKSKILEVEKQLQKVAPASSIIPIEPEKGESSPTYLKNSKVFYPFELITGIFGYPSQDEFDPTAILSGFYILFFAICLSDVGYGIVLAVISLYFLKTLTLSEGGKKLLILLFWGGIATIIIGMLTGAYFGADPSIMPQPFNQLLLRLKLIDPIKNPLSVLAISLILGFFQNIFGIFVSMVQKIYNGDLMDGILDDGLWIFFLISIAGFGVSKAVLSSISNLFYILTIIGAILLVLTQGRHEKSIIQKFLKGFLSLYRVTSYLGDTLSYSRLLALMMTTSIIGMVINLIAHLTSNIPFVGYILMFTILIFGHLFNLVISVLGAFVHSTRLQLVEFFGKFYQGAGKEFKPFSYNTKYVTIK